MHTSGIYAASCPTPLAARHNLPIPEAPALLHLFQESGLAQETVDFGQVRDQVRALVGDLGQDVEWAAAPLTRDR